MSWQKDQFDGHAVHNTLAQVMGILGEVDFKSTDSEENSKFSYAHKLLHILEVNLKDVDYDLVHPNMLNDINSHLGQIFQNLESSKNSGGKVENIDSINGSLHHILESSGGWILRNFSDHDKAVMHVMKSMTNAKNNFIKSLEKDKSHAEESLGKLISSLTDQVRNTEALSNRISQQKEESESSLTNWKERGEQQLADWLKQFSSDQGTRQNDFSDSQESRQENFLQWLNGFKQDSANNMNAIMEELSNIEKDSRKKHNEILSLHGLTAGDSVSAGYIKDAKKESHFANKWRMGSVFALIFAAIVPVLAIFGNWYGTGSLKIEVPLGVMPITFILVGLSTYCAFQSTKHRNMEFLNRRLSLEMKAIGPYIESFDEDAKVKIKSALIPVFFGSREFLKKDAKISDENVLLSFIKEFITNKTTSSS